MQIRKPLHLSVPSALRATVNAGVTLLSSPFRKSIWKKTNEYHFGSCTAQELEDVAQLYAIVAAKLRIAFPTSAVCKELRAAIAAMPDDPALVAPDYLTPMLKQFLRATEGMRGVGIPVAICALAVMKQGRYAPMDRKNAAGLLNLEVVTAAEAKQLTGMAISTFIEVYVTKVLPAWYAQTRLRTPEQADAFWGSHA